MTPNSAPIVAARVLFQHGLAPEVISGYVTRTWALDARQCAAVITAAQFLVQQEAAARTRTGRFVVTVND